MICVKKSGIFKRARIQSFFKVYFEPALRKIIISRTENKYTIFVLILHGWVGIYIGLRTIIH